MNCPECGCVRTKVVLTRVDPNGFKIRRRRCLGCDHRYYSIQSNETLISKYDLVWRRGKNRVVSTDDGDRRHTEEVIFTGDRERIFSVGDA
jgi:transcriptional regulator NrdR family protein